MKDFGRWFSDFTLPEAVPAAAEEPEFPDGVYPWNGGRPHADCCCCGRKCNVSEFIDDPRADFTRWYGICGPSCCP